MYIVNFLGELIDIYVTQTHRSQVYMLISGWRLHYFLIVLFISFVLALIPLILLMKLLEDMNSCEFGLGTFGDEAKLEMILFVLCHPR